MPLPAAASCGGSYARARGARAWERPLPPPLPRRRSDAARLRRGRKPACLRPLPQVRGPLRTCLVAAFVGLQLGLMFSLRLELFPVVMNAGIVAFLPPWCHASTLPSRAFRPSPRHTCAHVRVFG